MNKTFQCVKCGKQFKAGIITSKEFVKNVGLTLPDDGLFATDRNLPIMAGSRKLK